MINEKFSAFMDQVVQELEYRKYFLEVGSHLHRLCRIATHNLWVISLIICCRSLKRLKVSWTKIQNLKLSHNYVYLHYKAKVIFSYHGFIGEDDWFNFAHYKAAGLQNHWSAQIFFGNGIQARVWQPEVGKSRPDLNLVQIIWKNRPDFFLVQIEIWILSGQNVFFFSRFVQTESRFKSGKCLDQMKSRF